MLRIQAPSAAAAVVTLALLSVGASAAAGQDETVGGDRLRVHLDCQSFLHCDLDHYRREIGFVNWVREPEDSQVHVIFTSRAAGGGGYEFTFDFVGREELGGMEDRYLHGSSVTDVPDEVIAALTQVLSLGLVRYAATAGFGDALGVAAVETEETDEPGAAPAGGEVDDPWNFWVFSLSASGGLSREDLRRSHSLGFGATANRTTAEWKLNWRASGNTSHSEFDLPAQDTTITNDQDRWSSSAYAVKSLGGHAGVGVEVEANNSTLLNRELLVAVGTGVEYDYFPYEESNRRSLLAKYVVSAEHVTYVDTTVFDVLEETVYRHEASLGYSAREAWGTASLSLTANQYLDRTDFYSLRLFGSISYRLFRGFSVNLFGSWSRVRDQIYLSKSVLTDEDILLGRRQLPTDEQLSFNLGLSYRFGSIFNNAVNPRFGSGVR